MSRNSSYLDFLPPVLWDRDASDGSLPLGQLLCIFEKVLTGIDDGVPIAHTATAPDGTRTTHEHRPLAATIENIARQFDPWRTPARDLAWLASWVALEFPSLQGQPLWDEYQCRAATSVIAQIHRRRGLQSGLQRYLDLHATAFTRPRIAIDDGNHLMVVTPRPGQLVPIATLAGTSCVRSIATVGDPGQRVRVLDRIVRPNCLAVGGDGTVFVGDAGADATGVVPAIASRVWRIDAAGQVVDHADLPAEGALPSALSTPQPLARDSLKIKQVKAIAVRPPRGARPETLFVLDRSGALFSLPTPYTGDAVPEGQSLAEPGRVFQAVAMVIDSNGDVVILERGNKPGQPAQPKLTVVAVTDAAVAAPTRIPLQRVIEPMSMAALPGGALLVGDGRQQLAPTADQRSGNLVRVQRGAAVTETLLLPPVNSLVAPTGLVADTENHCYVLDVGMKPLAATGGDNFLLDAAEPAAVYSVSIAGAAPVIERVTEAGRLVYPAGMVALGARLVICDPGLPEQSGIASTVAPRVLPYRFTVLVHFANTRLGNDPVEGKRLRQRVVGNIRNIVEAHKPAHTLCALISPVPH